MNKGIKRAVVLGMTAITLLVGMPATNVKAAELKPVHTNVAVTGKTDNQKVTYKLNIDKSVVSDGRVAVEYDPAVLEYKSDSENIRFSEVDVNKDFSEDGLKAVAYAFVGDSPKTVNGTLMTVQFTVKSGLKAQNTKIGTKIYGINNEEATVVENTVLEDSVSVGRGDLKKPVINGIYQAIFSVHINWTKDNNADGYVIYRSTSKNGKYSKVGTVKKATNYLDASVANKKTYYYKVMSYQGSGDNRVYSQTSDPVSIKVKKFFGIFG